MYFSTLSTNVKDDFIKIIFRYYKSNQYLCQKS